MVNKDIDFSKIKEAGIIRTQILHQQRRGRMNVIHVIGLPGTGKSWACLRLAELLSDDLHGQNDITARNVVNSLLGLLKFIRAIKKDGEIVICEEIGVWLSSRRSMAAENVDAGYVWDTLRKKRVIVIANNPIGKDVDKKLVSLSSLSIQTLSLNKKEGVCILKPLRLQTNPSSGKTYLHRLLDNGAEVHRCWVGKPQKELTDAYEDDKDIFLDKLYERLQKKHEEKEEKDILKVTSNVLPTDAQVRRKKLRDKGLTLLEIAKLEGITESGVGDSLQAYEAKMKKLKIQKNSKDETAQPPI